MTSPGPQIFGFYAEVDGMTIKHLKERRDFIIDFPQKGKHCIRSIVYSGKHGSRRAASKLLQDILMKKKL